MPPAAWPDAAAYDAAVRRLIGQGAALDERSVYFLARLSPRYPTVEVRIAGACLDAGTAVLLAGLTRALVATALAEARRGTPPAAAPARQVAAALTAAARHGLAGAGTDPFTGQAADARSLLSRLLEHVYPALSDHGDTETITRLLRRLDQRGTGADRQRALFTSAASTPAFITALARATLSGHEPGRRRRPDARTRQRQARSRGLRKSSTGSSALTWSTGSQGSGAVPGRTICSGRVQSVPSPASGSVSRSHFARSPGSSATTTPTGSGWPSTQRECSRWRRAP